MHIRRLEYLEAGELMLNAPGYCGNKSGRWQIYDRQADKYLHFPTQASALEYMNKANADMGIPISGKGEQNENLDTRTGARQSAGAGFRRRSLGRAKGAGAHAAKSAARPAPQKGC